MQGGKARCALPLSSATVLVSLIKAQIHIVHIVALRIKEPAERTLGYFSSCEYRRGVVVARLAHHVGKTGFLDDLEDLADFVLRHGHRDGGIDVLACTEGFEDKGAVRPALSKDRYSVDKRRYQCIFEAIEGATESSLRSEGFGPVRNEVGDKNRADSRMVIEEGCELSCELSRPDDCE